MHFDDDGQYPHLANAIAVTTGRRLDIVSMISVNYGFPDITALVVSSTTARPGSRGPQDPVVLAQALSFNWQGVQFCFDEIEKIVNSRGQNSPSVKKPKINREDALRHMSDFYKAHKEKFTKRHRKIS